MGLPAIDVGLPLVALDVSPIKGPVCQPPMLFGRGAEAGESGSVFRGEGDNGREKLTDPR